MQFITDGKKKASSFALSLAAVWLAGQLIAYLGFDDALRAYEDNDLYVMNRDGSNVRNLTADWNFSPAGIVWDADGRGIYAQYDISGETRVARIALDGSVRDVVDGLSGGGLDRPYTGGSFSVAKNDVIASTGGPPTRPAELRLTRGGDTRILTDLNRSLREVKTMGEVRKITRLAPDVVSINLRFPIGTRAVFRAGQYLRVMLPDGDSCLGEGDVVAALTDHWLNHQLCGHADRNEEAPLIDAAGHTAEQHRRRQVYLFSDHGGGRDRG